MFSYLSGVGLYGVLQAVDVARRPDACIRIDPTKSQDV
jgi:hypothetical protein